MGFDPAARGALSEIDKITQYVDGTNLFNPTKRTIGSFIDASSGTLVANSTYDTTDFISVKSGQSYAITQCRKIVFFNTSKVFNSGIDVSPVSSQVVTASVDGFIRVSFNATDIGSSQIEKGSNSTSYQPYAQKIAIPIDLINGLVQPAVSKNLFDSSTRTIGYYVSEVNGGLVSNASYDTSDYMPVSANTSYAITACRKIAYFTSSKGFISGLDIPSLTPQVVTTPANAAFIKVSFRPADITISQVEKGSTQTSYEAFGTGSETYTLSDKVIIPNVSGTNTLNVANADKAGFIGDSYTESHYTVKGKAYINKLSLFSDYNFENFAKSGDTYRGNLDRIRKKQGMYHATLSWQDFKPKYAFLVSYTNDLKYMDHEQYANDLRAVIETVQSLGALPIISTEYHSSHGNGLQNILKQVAEEYGAEFVNILPKVVVTRGADYAPFWGGSHPGTRSNSIFSDNIEKYLKLLPRPRQSLKIFRPRGGITISTLDDLVFNTNVERAKKFKEIQIGHSALTDKAKVDEVVDGMANTNITSEYLKLQNSENVAFTDYALVSAVLPATTLGLTSLALVISETAAQVYVKDITATPYATPTFYQRFDVADTTGVTVDATYTSNDAAFSGTTFTVKEISGNSILMSPYKGGSNGSGTLTKVSGTGPASIAYSYTAVGYASDYPVGKQNIGHWVEVTKDVNNKFTVSSSILKRCVDYDKVHFIVKKTGAFNLNKVEVEWSGKEDKVYRYRPLKLQEPTGTEMLAQTNMGNASELSGWTIEGTATTYVPADSVLPKGTIGCIDITTANKVKQTITYTSTDEDVEFEIKAYARYFPAIYSSATDYDTNCLITEESYDYAELAVDIIQGSKSFTMSDRVNLHWKEVIFRAYLPNNTTSQTIRLYSKDKTIQLAKVSVKRV